MDQPTILGTPRLLLRRLTAADRADLAEILQNPAVMVAYEGPFSGAEVDTWLDRQLARYAQDGIGLWAVIDKASGAFLGQCGLTWQETPEGTVLEIGYLLKESAWHKGYATEAAEGCKEYAFTTMDAGAVHAIIRDTNSASIGVAARLGMHPAFHFTKHYRGVDMPHTVYRVQRG